MAVLSTLPDVCLFNIFGRLFVIDQLHLGKVCRRLRLLQVSFWKQPSKLAFFTIDPRIIPEPGLIKIEAITDQVCDNIVKYFPCVVDLKIDRGYYEFQEELDSLARLLQNVKWSSKLVSLTLLYISHSENIRDRTNLAKSINSLPSLKYLTLISALPPKQLYNLSILPKLKQFCYNASHGENLILKLFQTHSDSIILLDQLKSIEIDDDYSWAPDVLEAYLKLDPNLTSRFSKFAQPHIDISNDLLTRFCVHFPSLESIRIRLPKNEPSLVRRLNCLSSLVRLNSFGLCIYDAITFESDVQIAPLPSLKHLTVRIDIGNSQSREVDPILYLTNIKYSHHFPNLLQVEIEFPLCIWMVCTICGESYESEEELDVNDHEEVYQEHYRKCLFQFIEPLKDCAQLQQITTTSPNTTIRTPFEEVFFHVDDLY